MNIFILADIQDVMKSPHPIYGIPMGLGLLIGVIYLMFRRTDSPPSLPKEDFSWRYKSSIPSKDEDWKLPKEIRNKNKSKPSEEDTFHDIVNPKPDCGLPETKSVKEQLLIDLRKAAEMGMMTKKEYGIKRQKILDMP